MENTVREPWSYCVPVRTQSATTVCEPQKLKRDFLLQGSLNHFKALKADGYLLQDILLDCLHAKSLLKDCPSSHLKQLWRPAGYFHQHAPRGIHYYLAAIFIAKMNNDAFDKQGNLRIKECMAYLEKLLLEVASTHQYLQETCFKLKDNLCKSYLSRVRLQFPLVYFGHSNYPTPWAMHLARSELKHLYITHMLKQTQHIDSRSLGAWLIPATVQIDCSNLLSLAQVNLGATPIVFSTKLQLHVRSDGLVMVYKFRPGMSLDERKALERLVLAEVVKCGHKYPLQKIIDNIYFSEANLAISDDLYLVYKSCERFNLDALNQELTMLPLTTASNWGVEQHIDPQAVHKYWQKRIEYLSAIIARQKDDLAAKKHYWAATYQLQDQLQSQLDELALHLYQNSVQFKQAIIPQVASSEIKSDITKFNPLLNTNPEQVTQPQEPPLAEMSMVKSIESEYEFYADEQPGANDDDSNKVASAATFNILSLVHESEGWSRERGQLLQKLKENQDQLQQLAREISGLEQHLAHNQQQLVAVTKLYAEFKQSLVNKARLADVN